MTIFIYKEPLDPCQKSNNIQPDWDNLLMYSLVGQEKKGKRLGVGGGVARRKISTCSQLTYYKHKRALVISGKILIFSRQWLSTDNKQKYKTVNTGGHILNL